MKYTLACCLFFCSHSAWSQTDEDFQKNIIKINIPGIVINNYALQYERILNKKASLAITVRYMPESNMPFQNLLIKEVAGDDPTLKATLANLKLSNFAFTPEYRFYLGKGFGSGFYVAPFYRYASFKSNNIFINYQGDLLTGNQSINLSGDLTSHTAGILLGAQWKLGKINIDWMILGPHLGRGKGNFSGVSTRALNANEQQQIREELENLDIPFTKKEIVVSANTAQMKLNGPWGGVRAGLSIGINF